MAYKMSEKSINVYMMKSNVLDKVETEYKDFKKRK